MADVQPGFYIIEGWKNRAELYINGFKVINLPVQTDMRNGRRWIRPGNTADVLTPAKLVDTPIGSRFAYGGLTFNWPMQGLSPNMVGYLQTTFFTPGTTPSNFFQRAWYNKLTVQTFNRASGEWETYQTYGRFANLASEAEPALGGYNNLQVSFTAYKVAPLGPDVEPTASIPTTIYNGDITPITFNIDNTGDGDTFGDTFLFVEIPPNFEYSSADSVADIDIEYSTDGGTIYSPTPPGDLGDVTDVRIQYNPVIVTGGTSADILVYLVPLLVSADNEADVTATTDGDQETDNDTITISLDVVAWSPLAISGLQLWFNADEDVFTDAGGTTPAANGDPVARWNNLSGASGREALQTTPAQRPTFRTGQANGHSALDFITDDTMTGVLSLTSAPTTVAIVIDADHDGSTGDDETLLYVLNDMIFAHIDGQATFMTDVALKSGATWQKYDTAVAGLQLYVFVNVTGAFGSRLYRDGALAGLQYSGTQRAAAGFYFIGDTGSLASNFEGLIYEVVMYNVEVTGVDKDNLTDYLMTKYAI